MLIAWVDDDADFRDLVACHVDRWAPHEVCLTGDVAHPAIATAELFVVDLAMVDVDGMTLVEQAVARRQSVVVVSGLLTPHMRRLVRTLGADAAWEKQEIVASFPSDPWDLLEHR